MIASDCDRGFQMGAFDEIVYCLTHLGAFPITKPTDARWQSLKMNAIACEPKPAVQRSIIRKEFERQIVGFAYVVRITGERHPPKRTLPFAEDRSNVFGNETWDFKGFRATSVECLLAYVVTVVENDGSGPL